MVVPRGVDVPPIAIVTGTEFPGVTLGGIVTLICITPVISPGAAPAKFTVAGRPPTVAVTPGIVSNWDALAGIGVTLPVALGGSVCPPPVAYSAITEPRGAG